MPSQKQTITLVKLGGSVITNKELPMHVRREALERLTKEIAEARAERPNELLLVGHGSGSFAHVPAGKYRTREGFVTDESVLGMAIVQDAAAQLNREVIAAFLAHGVPAVSWYPSNSWVTSRRVSEKFFDAVLLEYLKQGVLPVAQGDVLVDSEQGCTIWSTEEVLAFLAEYLTAKNWQVTRVIHVTEVAGFLDLHGQVVPKITPKNWPSLESALSTTKGFDVTGGMGLKVTESLRLAAKGIESIMISGLQPGNLYNALRGEVKRGTIVSRND